MAAGGCPYTWASARPLASITRYPPGIGSNLHGRGKRRCGMHGG
jgi:hypothetical protein